MRILIDIKNLALYGGGISHWFSPLLAAWISHRSDAKFLLVGPSFNTNFLPRTHNWEHVSLSWPAWLPRPLRHPWYDNVVFPRAVSRFRPDLMMSPYHDVRMSKGVPSIVTVHDLCIDELASVYPRHIRAYYLALLRHNLRRASFVITVSETSREKLTERYDIAPDRVGVVYNTPPAAFAVDAGAGLIAEFRKRHGVGGPILFYPGGTEHRKNVRRLVEAFARLARQNDGLTLLVTGEKDARWEVALAGVPDGAIRRVRFSGRLDDAGLRLAYAAVDAVVYPSLCEGFGRVCLEAMDTGTPLACSDLAVMREVAGDYAHYFDPNDIGAIAGAMTAALGEGRRSPARDARFRDVAVREAFLNIVDQFASGRPSA